MDYADIVRPEEMTRSRRWLAEALETLRLRASSDAGAPRPCIGFQYNGKPGADFLRTWPFVEEDLGERDGCAVRRFTWSDARTRLQIALEIKAYSHFPVIEWVAWFKNTGQAETPVLTDIQGLDVTLACAQDPILHHNQGDTCGRNAYEPKQLLLEKGSEYRFAPVGGRPTSVAFPYFNLQQDGQGAIVAIGWPGQWAAQFARDEQGAVRVRGGQEVTRLALMPGESIRTPLAVLMFWNGDLLHAQNLWRRWMWAHNVPRNQGELPLPLSGMCSGLRQIAADEIRYIDTLALNRVQQNLWWIDAGWYPTEGGWPTVGTWRPDPERFPQGIRAVSDHAHANGMRLVLWFEMERVSPGTAWCSLPQWLLPLPEKHRRPRLCDFAEGPRFIREEAERNEIRQGDRLFNLGNPEACKFITDYMSQCIEEWGIDIFRLDHNISPLAFWRAADAPDRQGSTENHYVVGLLSFFDELRRRHPNLLIDSCASGGRRIDLETLRRTVVYTRSDFWCRDPDADQAQTHGVASWVPHFMTSCPHYEDDYWYVSNLNACLGMDFPHGPNDTVDWALFGARVAEWQRVAQLYYGDYYPLTAWSTSPDATLAWQFDRPDQGAGIVQVFRRRDSVAAVVRLKLHGLDPAATYDVTDLRAPGQVRKMAGQELLEAGLTVALDRPREAAAIVYQRQAHAL